MTKTDYLQNITDILNSGKAPCFGELIAILYSLGSSGVQREVGAIYFKNFGKYTDKIVRCYLETVKAVNRSRPYFSLPATFY